MNAPCTAPRLAYTGILSESYAAPRIRQRGFFMPVMGEFRLSFSMGDEEAGITNTAPGFITAESESPAPQKNWRLSLKVMEANHGPKSRYVPPPYRSRSRRADRLRSHTANGPFDAGRLAGERFRTRSDRSGLALLDHDQFGNSKPDALPTASLVRAALVN